MATQAPGTKVNLFVLLDLDSARPWSVTDIKRELQDRRGHWNRLSAQIGPRADEAKRRREQLKELNLTDILSSQSKLEEHRALARQETRAQQHQQVTALEDEIRFARAKGYLIQPEVDDLIARYAPTLTKGRVAEILNLETVRRPTDITSLSVVILDQIDRLLDNVHQMSLYTFLNATETTSRRRLVDEADRLAEDARKHPPTQAKFAYQKELAGHARHIFESDEKRAQYDQHLREARFIADVLKPYWQLCDLTKEISLAQVELLLERAASAGWKDDEAQQMLFALAVARGWRVQVPASARSSTTAAVNKVITELKQALTQARAENVEAERLSEAANKKRADVEAELLKARAQLSQFEKERDEALRRDADWQSARNSLQAKYEAAEEKAKRLETEKRAQSKVDQERLAQVRSEAEGLRQQLAQQQSKHERETQQRISELTPRLQEHLVHAELMQAQAIINSFPTVPPQWAANARRVEEGIALAEQRLEEAQRLSVPPAWREELVAQSLAACADYMPALEYRNGLEPQPPADLLATPDAHGVSLTWQSSPSQSVTYTVVRKNGSALLSLNDGERLATVQACTWHDASPPPGHPIFYAVFAQRGPLVSSQAARLTQPILLTPDVTNVRTEVDDGSVTLSWVAPASCSAVIVVRRELIMPQSINDGTQQTIRTTSHWTDSALQNGCTYFYRLYAEYWDHAGQVHRSSGVAASATPDVPPRSVPALVVTGSDGILSHTIHLDARPPERGQLCIYRSDAPPTASAGDHVSEVDLGIVFGATGHKLSGTSDSLFAASVVYYTPVLLFQGTAYIGEPQRYCYAPPVGPLYLEVTRVGVHVTWQWPLKCAEAEIRWGSTGKAGALGTTLASATVRRVGGEHFGSYDLPPLGRGAYSIEVRAHYVTGGQIEVSESRAAPIPGDQRIVVRYAVSARLRVLGAQVGARQHRVELEADEPVGLPELRVVAKEASAPEGLDDGAACGKLPAQQYPGRKWTIPITGYPVGPATRIAVFPEPGGRITDIVLVAQHPGN